MADNSIPILPKFYHAANDELYQEAVCTTVAPTFIGNAVLQLFTISSMHACNQCKQPELSLLKLTF